jgi:hypothetical protein
MSGLLPRMSATSSNDAPRPAVLSPVCVSEAVCVDLYAEVLNAERRSCVYDGLHGFSLLTPFQEKYLALRKIPED